MRLAAIVLVLSACASRSSAPSAGSARPSSSPIEAILRPQAVDGATPTFEAARGVALVRDYDDGSDEPPRSAKLLCSAAEVHAALKAVFAQEVQGFPLTCSDGNPPSCDVGGMDNVPRITVTLAPAPGPHVLRSIVYADDPGLGSSDEAAARVSAALARLATQRCP